MSRDLVSMSAVLSAPATCASSIIWPWMYPVVLFRNVPGTFWNVAERNWSRHMPVDFCTQIAAGHEGVPPVSAVHDLLDRRRDD